MINLGTVKPGSTIRIPFSSFDKDDGSSITMTNYAAADILVYKDGSTTERASTSGFTATTDFDSKTGKHLTVIDLADNTTAGFWAAGSEYLVAIDSVTVDTVTTGGWIARFRIGYPDAILDTTIASLSSQTSFTLTTGPAEDDALNGCVVLIHDIASAVQCGFAVVSDYTGSTKTVTLTAGVTFTAAASDNISIFPPVNTRWLGATLQTGRDIGTSVLLSSGTGTGQLNFTSGVVNANVTQVSGDSTAADTLELFAEALDQSTGQLDAGSFAAGAIDNAAMAIDGSELTAIPWNASWDAEVQSEVQDAIEVNNLDHLVKAAVDTDFATTVQANSVIGHLADNGAGFDRTTDSLEAIRDRGDAAWITAAGFSTHSAADVWAVGTRTLTALDEDSTTIDLDATIRAAVGLAAANLDTQLTAIDDYLDTEVAAIKAKTDNLPSDPADASDIAAATNAILARLKGLVLVEGTIGDTGNDTTHLHLENLPYGDDEINDHLLVIFDSSASEYHARWISDWVGATDLATLDSALPFTPQNDTDTYWLLSSRRDVSATGGSGATAQEVWEYATRTLTAIDEDSTTMDLDATILAAVGMATGNLDTQLADIEGKVDDLESRLGTPSDLGSGATVAANLVDIEGQTDNLPGIETKIDTIDDFLDTEVAAIKAKTDNLPSDPADASDIASSFSTVNSTLSTIAGYLDTEVSAIKAKTDLIPAGGFPANFSSFVITAAGKVTVGTNDDKTGYALSSTGLDLVMVAGKTLPAAVKLIGATTAGLLPSGAGSSTEAFQDFAGNTVVTFTVDSAGNRTAVIYG